MPKLSLDTPRFRHFAAIVVLVATAVILAVVLSQLFIGSGADPRSTVGSRAAGLGFTDRAHDTLYGAIPLALPLLAVWLSKAPGLRLVAVVLYIALILTGLVVTITAFTFGLDLGATQHSAGVDPEWIDTRAAVEFAFVDLAVLALAVLALLASVRAWRQVRPDAS